MKEVVARGRHLADRRLLLCLLLTSLLLASCGAGLVTVYLLYRGEVTVTIRTQERSPL